MGPAQLYHLDSMGQRLMLSLSFKDRLSQLMHEARALVIFFTRLSLAVLL